MTQKKRLMPFFMLGQYDDDTTVEIMKTAVKAGADFLELGIPHTDPLADGPLLRQAAERAIQNGMTPKKALGLASKIVADNPNVPIYLLVYLNTLFGYGVSDFANDAEKAGVTGVVIPDLPLEAQKTIFSEFNFGNLEIAAFVSPTSAERLQDIADAAHGFIYSVNYTGITGDPQNREPVDLRAKENYNLMKKMTSKPILSGFGIDSAESAKSAARYADGVIIGSKICEILNQSRQESILDNLYNFLNEVREGLE